MSSKKPNVLLLSDEQLSTVLAALAVYQPDQFVGDDAVMDIATNGGDHDALSKEEINELSETINSGEKPSFLDVMDAYSGTDEFLAGYEDRVGEYCGDNIMAASPVGVLIDDGVVYVTSFTYVPAEDEEE